MGTLQIICPNCQTQGMIDETLRGSTVRCRQCGKEFVVDGQPVAPPPAAFTPVAPPPPYAPSFTGAANEQLAQPTGTSTLAVTSLVLGILFCIPGATLAGLICGIVALTKINNSGGRIGGKGLAIAGIAVSGGMMLVAIPITAAILFPVLARGREVARQTTCMSNQRQIAATIQMYAQDHEETLPDGRKVWELIAVDAGVLVCPTKGKATPNGYGYNQRLSKVPIGTLYNPNSTMLTADGGDMANLLQGPQDLEYRHTKMAIVSYIDGHVGKINETQQPVFGP